MSWAAAGQAFADLARRKPALATVVVLCVLSAWAIWAHTGGLARGSELEKIKTEVSDLRDDVRDARLEALEGQAFEARVAQCRAESRELKELYAARVAKLLSDYRSAGGVDLRLPQCADL